tara:strand:- start:962 stop:1849 length:888 start_codon:yes stop_codon:yes gene_type:complete
MHLLSIDEFDEKRIDRLFTHANTLQLGIPPRPPQFKKILANLFYEPSTRTSSSFFSAMTRLGHTVLPINEVIYSSVTKGETLEDTIKTLSSYVDIIVLRHPSVGASKAAASVSSVPIINAGDGIGEHPTQTLLDLYTIWRKFKHINNLTVTLMGDLKNGRTVHSLVNVLRNLYDVNINLVSPDNLQLPYYLDNAAWRNLPRNIPKSTSLTENICKTTDVLYMTRVQKERGSVGEYTLTKDHIDLFKKNMIVMHPFPRQNEIPTWFDTDRRAYYFKQIQNGLYVRMAILSEIINAK